MKMLLLLLKHSKKLLNRIHLIRIRRRQLLLVIFTLRGMRSKKVVVRPNSVRLVRCWKVLLNDKPKVNLIIYWLFLFPLDLKTPRLRKSEWIASLNIFPRLQQWQESQIDFLKSAKELDFEILYELDLIKSNDIQFTQQRLKESAKRIIKPENYQNRSQQNIPTSAEHESESEEEQEGEGGNFNTDFDDVDSVEDDNVDNSESGKARKNKAFQFGMFLPDGREKIEVLNVLNAKKQTFGNMVRKNEELRAIEQELMEVDPVRAKILEQQIVQVFFIFIAEPLYSLIDYDKQYLC